MRAPSPGTYLDANAGVPLLLEAKEAMLSALGVGNASSVHAAGRAARRLIENARVEVAALVGAGPEHVVFTSGATEAANLALSPVMRIGGRSVPIGRLYVGATEHPCVLAGGRFAADEVEVVPVKEDGTIDLDALDAALGRHDCSAERPLVALMLANNETGVIHPVAEASRIVKAHDGLLFCDATQGAGRLAIDIGALVADFLALSAHKMGGPQGAGALVLADEDVSPAPLITGGGQELKRRAGTENVAAIVGFGVAARLAAHHLEVIGRIGALRNRFEAGAKATAPTMWIAGEEAPRLANTSLIAVPGMAAETAVIAFDLAGIAVSSGSACSSGKVGPSHVLEALGWPDEMARAGIRVSLPHAATDADIDRALATWKEICLRQGRQRAA